MKAKTARRKKGRAARGPWTWNDSLRWMTAIFFWSLPFVVSFNGFDKFRGPKAQVFAVAAILITAIFLIVKKPPLKLRLASWEFLAALAAVYLAVHCLWSENPSLSFSALYFPLCGLAFLIVLKKLAQEGFMRRLWLGIGATGAVNGIMTALQYHGLFPLLETPGGETLAGRTNAAGLLGDVNSGGMFFGLCAIILSYWVIAENGIRLRAAAGVLFLLNVVGLLYTRTLTALAAFGICILLGLLFFHLRHFRLGRGFTRGLAILWGTLFLAAAGGAMIAYTAGLTQRIEGTWEQMRQGQWTKLTSGRQPVFAISWEMIQDRPLLGHGLQTFPQEFFDYKVGTEAGRARTLLDQPGAFRQVHNEYLQAWLELGLPGLLLLGLLLIVPLTSALKKIRLNGDDPSHLRMATIAFGLVYLALDGLGFFPFQTALGASLTILLLADLRAFVDASEWPKQHWKNWQSQVKALALILLAAALLYRPYQHWSANLDIGDAQRFLTRAIQLGRGGSSIRFHAQVRAAIGRLDRAAERCPSCAQIYDLKGSAYAILGNAYEAAKQYSLAIRYAPTPERYTRLGLSHFQEKRFEDARQALETAVAYRPRMARAKEALRALNRLER